MEENNENNKQNLEIISNMTNRPPLYNKMRPPVRYSHNIMSRPMSFIPEPLLQQILSYLQPKDLAMISPVDKQMNIEASKVAELCVKKIIREVFMADASDVLKRLNISRLSFYKKFLNDLRKKRILVLNGTSKVSSMIDIKSNTWTECSTSMNQHRAAFSSVWYRGELVVISGNVPDIATGTVEMYNPFTDTWRSLSSLPQRLRYASGAVLHNQLYVIGGFNKTTGIASSAVYRYETINDNIRSFEEGSDRANAPVGYWNLIDIPLPVGRYTHAAVGFDGKIWIAGGFPKPNSVQIFDPLLGDWSEGPPLVARRAQFKLLVVNGDLFAVGGDDATTNRTTIEKFDRKIQAWSIITTLKEQRLMLSSSAAGSKIYIFGGMVSSTKALDTWDAFDVRTNTWDSDIQYDVEEYDDRSEDEDDGYGIGYDFDSNDVDIDMEFGSVSPRTASNLSNSSSDHSDIFKIETDRSPKLSVLTAAISSQASSTPSSPGNSNRFNKQPPHLGESPCSNILLTTTPSPFTPSRQSSADRTINSQIQIAVPLSLKRNLSGSLISSSTPLRQISGSFIRTSPEFVSPTVKNLPSRNETLDDQQNFTAIAENKIKESSISNHSAMNGAHLKRHRKRIKRTITPIDRKIPFPHAFGCAVTIPAVCLYS